MGTYMDTNYTAIERLLLNIVNAEVLRRETLDPANCAMSEEQKAEYVQSAVDAAEYLRRLLEK